MRASVVVEAESVADGACGMLDAVKALAMNALLRERPDHAFDHAILLRAVRHDKLLLLAVAANQRGVIQACEDQAIVRPQKEFLYRPSGICTGYAANANASAGVFMSSA
jgi:hypothetical protein